MTALAFANIVTRHSTNPDDLIARCGRCSLFATLQQMIPHIIRDGECGERGGISEVEFNKLLQASGFHRIRNRRIGASNRATDPLGAGLYVFSGVRWLSPDDPCDAQLLSEGLARLARTLPHLGGAQQLERLASILRHNRSEWEQSPGAQTRRRRRRALRPCADSSSLDGTPTDASGEPSILGEHSSSAGDGSALALQSTSTEEQETGRLHHDSSLVRAGGRWPALAAYAPLPVAGPPDAPPSSLQPPACPFALASFCSPSSSIATACSAAHDPDPRPSGAQAGAGGDDECQWEGEGKWAEAACAVWEGGWARSVSESDLPPAGDVGGAWAQLDALPPQMLNSKDDKDD